MKLLYAAAVIVFLILCQAHYITFNEVVYTHNQHSGILFIIILEALIATVLIRLHNERK